MDQITKQILESIFSHVTGISLMVILLPDGDEKDKIIKDLPSIVERALEIEAGDEYLVNILKKEQ